MHNSGARNPYDLYSIVEEGIKKTKATHLCVGYFKNEFTGCLTELMSQLSHFNVFPHPCATTVKEVLFK